MIPCLAPALEQGLEKYGVGRWRDMATEHPALEAFDDSAIRTKAARLLGTQSLARHAGWKGASFLGGSNPEYRGTAGMA